MFKTVLVPTDGSPLSEKAIDGAIDYARVANAQVIGIAVVQPLLDYVISSAAATAVASLTMYAEESAKANLDNFGRRVRESGVQYDTVLAKGDRPWMEIIAACEASHCAAIFMGSHRLRGHAAYTVGSQTQKVLAHSKVPVLIYR
ncbi:MAG: universal stress protein [Burkholderiaceae bacterium]|jgi:nucleotide-binding universal stress UspA family protein